MKELSYKFKDSSLLDLALTQSGANSEHNNERLEFLGDRVLGLSVADMIYKMFPKESEGELARRHAVLVSTKTLAQVANGFGLDKLVKHGHMTGGKMDHISANAMESIIGAIFLDGGWTSSCQFVISEWEPLAKAMKIAPKDPRTELQELAQHTGDGQLPVYEIIEDKNSTFSVNVKVFGKSASGYGSTKKAASADAAEKLLKML